MKKGMVNWNAVENQRLTKSPKIGANRHSFLIACIWYALVLIGVILTSVMGGLLPVVRKRYAEAEARRVNAAVLRQGFTS
jgi:hypothetical protein